MDDYPVHQIAEPIRHVATSDRNFYDRYYFNCHPRLAVGGEPLMLIIGLGQYPNLGVTDAFAVLRRGDDHLVVRASRALGADRSDISVGPFRVVVVEGLRILRVILDPSPDNPAMSFDLTFTAGAPAALETRHFMRDLERVTFNTQRFVQAGSWHGSLTVDGERIEVTDRDWAGNRDRSWGVRPVGEAEPPGKRADPEIVKEHCFFWIYAVMQFDEFVITTLMHEDNVGNRVIEEATRVWRDPDRAPESLGHPEHYLEFHSGGREVSSAVLTFHDPRASSGQEDRIRVHCTPVLPSYLGVGTGYGLEEDWRHGMWQGHEVVQQQRQPVSQIEDWKKLFCPVDNLTRFELEQGDSSLVGEGLFEVAVIGTFPRYGFHSMGDVAP